MRNDMLIPKIVGWIFLVLVLFMLFLWEPISGLMMIAAVILIMFLLNTQRRQDRIRYRGREYVRRIPPRRRPKKRDDDEELLY